MVFFLLPFVIFSSFFINSVVRGNIRVNLALANPAGTPITIVKEIILIPPTVADKTIKVLSK